MGQNRLRIVAKAPAAERTDVDYLLTGKLFCDRCGSPMTGESGTGKSGRKFYYYTCVGRKRFRTCEKKPVKKDWIEDYEEAMEVFDFDPNALTNVRRVLFRYAGRNAERSRMKI